MPAEGLNDYRTSTMSKITGLSTAEKISPRATLIMDLHIQGISTADIARRLGITARYVGQILNAPNFQHQLAIRQERLRERMDDKIVNTTIDAANELRKHAKSAADRMVELLDSKSESISLKASTELLKGLNVLEPNKGAVASASVVIVDEKAAALINETLKMDLEEIDGG